MSLNYSIIGVEGNHDQAFVSKVLTLLEFQIYKGQDTELDPFWEKFKPTYPKNWSLD